MWSAALWVALDELELHAAAVAELIFVLTGVAAEDAAGDAAGDAADHGEGADAAAGHGAAGPRSGDADVSSDGHGAAGARARDPAPASQHHHHSTTTPSIHRFLRDAEKQLKSGKLSTSDGFQTSQNSRAGSSRSRQLDANRAKSVASGIKKKGINF